MTTARRCMARLVVLALVAGWAMGCAPDDDGVARPSSTESPAPSGSIASGWRSTNVVDGDTLDVSGPDGSVTVRIIGINTPESGECFAEDATDALAELVEGEALVLVADRTDVDRFGRALRYVETTGGTDVGAELVAGGLAIARRYPPDDARADTYAELQLSLIHISEPTRQLASSRMPSSA